jgi:hypothetical protein
MKSAVLAIRIIGDATSAVAAMDKAKASGLPEDAQAARDLADQCERFEKKLYDLELTLGNNVLIGAGAKVCVDAAADLQQSVGGVETVFGSSAGKMKQWSDNAAQAVGLSKNEYNEFATLVGSQLQNFGMSVDESADKTNELITLGADLSSMFGGTTADAVDALSAALKGEMDPIEKYGISLNDATLKAQAASMGLGDLYKSGDRNAKMQATLAAITAQSGKATGNFARESDTLQGQQQRMAAAFENTKATLGEALLPILTQVAAKLAEFATWVQQNTSWLVPLIGVIAAVAAVIITLNAAMTAYSAVATIVAIAQGSVNLAFLPVIAVILAVVAVIALLVMNWDNVKAAGAAAAQWIADKWNAFMGWLAGIGASLKQWGIDTWNAIGQAFQPVADFLGGYFKLLLSMFTLNFDGMKQAGQQMFNALPGPAQDAINRIIGFFTGLKDKVLGVFDSIVGAIKGAFKWVSDLWGKITGAKSEASGLSAQSYSTQAAAYALPVRQYAMSRAITPSAPTTYTAPTVNLARAIVAPANRADTTRPATVNVNISVDAHGNLDNDKVAGEIVNSLDRWARVRGKELAL